MSPFNSGPLILLCAVRDCDVKKVEELLDKQSLKLDDEWTDYIILIQALRVGNSEIVKLLLHHGYRVKAPKTDAFFTPLYYAVNRHPGNNFEILKVLLEAGASIVDKDKNTVTPLYLAFSNDELALVDLMFSMYNTENINPLNQDEIVHFHIACIRGNASLVEHFIRKGININTVADCSSPKLNGCTPLHAAVANKKIEIVKMLLEFGADYTVQGSHKCSPLHTAYYKYMNSNLHKSTYSYDPAGYRKIDQIGIEIINLILQAHTANGLNAIDNHGISHFHIACASNDVNLVKKILDCGVDVNCGINRECKVSDMILPLHLAIKYNHLEVVKILLQHNALDKMKTEILNSILYLAVEYNHVEVVKLLIEHGMDRDAESLHLAVKMNYKEVVGILLNKNADVDAKDESGFTLLQSALNHEFYEIVELLLKFGANVCMQNEKKSTPIHVAFSKLPKSSRCLDLMLSIHGGLMENVVNDKGLSVFHIACSQGNADNIENFLKRGVDIDACTKWEKYAREGTIKFTALHFAASAHNLDAVQLLLDHGAQVDATEYTGSTPLGLVFESLPLCSLIEKSLLDKLGENFDVNAIRENADKIVESVFKASKHMEIIQLFIDKKSNLIHENEYGQSLLFKMYQNNVTHIPEGQLLSMCYRIICKNLQIHNEIRDVIFELCSKIFAINYKKMMSVLIDQDINFNIQDKDGNNLLHHMCNRSYFKCTGQNVATVAEMILKRGCNPHSRNKQGQSPFHLAVSNACLELVTLLIKLNVQTDCRDVKLRTPMHLAKYHFCKSEEVNIIFLKIVQILVDSSRDVDIRDGKNQTPLFQAVNCDKSGYGTKYLLEANCDVNASDENGETPIFIAAENCNVTGIQMLLDYGADINVVDNEDMSLMSKLFDRHDMIEMEPRMHLVLKVLAAHIRKLLVIGYPVSECNLEYCMRLENAYNRDTRSKISNINLRFSELDKKFVAELKKELEEMKTAQIDAYTTLYDLLMKSAQGMSKHVKNEEFKKYLFDEKKKTGFPHYHSILHAKYRGGVARRLLLKSAVASLGVFMGKHLPASCVDYIFNHLSDQDLKSLIRSKALYV